MATETIFKIDGMHCSSCAQRLGQTFERRDGVIKADVDPAGTARIRYDETQIDEEQLGQLVRTSGFDLA